MASKAFCTAAALLFALILSASALQYPVRHHPPRHPTRNPARHPTQHPKQHPTQPTAGASTKATDLRLPTAIEPESYVVILQPLINGNFTTFGYVEILLNVIEETSNVTLHILDIITRNETIALYVGDVVGEEQVTILENTYDPERNFYIATLEQPLVVGQQYLLVMYFEGYLNDQLAGFYRSQYTNDDGTQTWLATTQFESTDARRAFPCFDEPAFKATFQVYLARQTSMTSIANMPLTETLPFDDGEDWVWDLYATSLPMSTYLVAFVVSDFTFVNSTFNDHVLFRVWAREEAIDQTWYAIGAGPAILTWYEEYFAIPFPLPKQDMIGLPDFSAGAMENWGLVTYRETAIFIDPELNSAYNRERVASVIAHELAHQWFGDLVTLEWWNNIWLNEGFATYVEYLGTNSYEPDWQYLDMIVPYDVQYSFIPDSLESSHPINVEVETSAEIEQLFDTISYSKGGSIIRMMNFFLTEPTFRAGLTNYLTAHEYNNANQDDLWEALTEQGQTDGTLPEDLTVKTIMDTWTLQMGYPVIDVVRSDDGTITLTQERFLLLKNPNSTDTHDYKWWVPVSYTTQGAPDFTQTQPAYWIPSTEDSITIEGIPTDEWVFFNLQETGFYRVNYDADTWQLLISQLNTDLSVIHLTSRSQLIDDAWSLARSGRIEYDIGLSLDTYLSQETEFVPWESALSNLEYLEEQFTRTSGYGQLEHYLLDLLVPLYDEVGFEDNADDPQLEQKKRVLAVDWACHLGLEDCVTNSVDLFAQWIAAPADQTGISSNLASTIYCTAVEEGGEAEWDFAWAQYLESNIATEQDRLLYALSCTKEVWILSKYLDMAFTEDSGIRRQDALGVFSDVSNNDVGRDIAWAYLQNNADLIASYYNSYDVLPDFVYYATDEFNTEQELQELIAFRDEYIDEIGSTVSYIDQSIENASNNVAWMNSYYDYIVDWLANNGYPAGVKRVTAHV